MSDTSTTELFSQYNQIDIQNIYLFRFDVNGNEPDSSYFLDIRSMMEELNIFETVYDPSGDTTLSAQIMLVDGLNIADNFPILGGEVVRIIYKTPSITDVQTLDFIVSRVGDRVRQNNNSKTLGYILYLCTLDKYIDVNIDLSMAFTGTYDEVIKGCLGSLSSDKPFDSDKTDGIQNFIAPMWSPLKTIKWCASRSVDSNLSPFFFYESLDGYHFKSIKNLYDADPVKQLYIEATDVPAHIVDSDKAFNTVLTWEYKETNDKLKQYARGVFGTNVYFFDIDNKTIEINEYDYTQQFTDNDISVEDYQLYDDMKGFRDKNRFFFIRNDGSHLGKFQRETLLNTMDSMRLLASIPGDSSLRLASIVLLDIPSNTGGADYSPEKTTSGRWFISKIRHIIKRDRYTMTLELVKDSYKIDINTQIIGVTNAEAKQSGS